MSKYKYENPKTLRDIFAELSKLHAEVMQDRAMVVQACESANVMGKMIAASKAHLEGCKLNKAKVTGEWADIILK